MELWRYYNYLKIIHPIQKNSWEKNTLLISVLILLYSLACENHYCQINWFANSCSLTDNVSIHSMLIYHFYLWRITNEGNKADAWHMATDESPHLKRASGNRMVHFSRFLSHKVKRMDLRKQSRQCNFNWVLIFL